MGEKNASLSPSSSESEGVVILTMFLGSKDVIPGWADGLGCRASVWNFCTLAFLKASSETTPVVCVVPGVARKAGGGELGDNVPPGVGPDAS